MLHCTMLHHTTLCRTTPLPSGHDHIHKHNSHTTLHYTTLHYSTLHYASNQCFIIPPQSQQMYTVLHYAAAHYTGLLCTTPHYITLHCSTQLHWETLHTHSPTPPLSLTQFLVLVLVLFVSWFGQFFWLLLCSPQRWAGAGVATCTSGCFRAVTYCATCRKQTTSRW